MPPLPQPLTTAGEGRELGDEQRRHFEACDASCPAKSTDTCPRPQLSSTQSTIVNSISFASSSSTSVATRSVPASPHNGRSYSAANALPARRCRPREAWELPLRGDKHPRDALWTFRGDKGDRPCRSRRPANHVGWT